MSEIEPTFRVFHADDMSIVLDVISRGLIDSSDGEIQVVLQASTVNEAIGLVVQGQLELQRITVALLDGFSGRSEKISTSIREMHPKLPIFGLSMDKVVGVDKTILKDKDWVSNLIKEIKALPKD